MARWYVNPLVKEMRMQWNPRRRRHHRHNRHHHRRHHRHNPDMGGVTSLVRQPGTLLADGAFTALGAYWTASLPNMFGLGFPGTDLISKVLRLAVRGLTGGLLYSGVRRFAPHYSSSVLSGSLLMAGGGFLFDLFGWSVVVGSGDTAQAGILPGGLAMPSLSGYGAYTRPQLGAYTRPQLGAYTHRLGAVRRPFSRAGALVPRGSFGHAANLAGFYGGGSGFYG